MPLTVFGAQQANNDVELWGSDGTTGRTFLIKNINPSGSANVGNSKAGTGGSIPFAVLNGFAYFSADDGTTGQELWRTDGTLAGTTRMTDLPAGSYSPSNIVAANGFIFFIGTGGIFRFNPATGITTNISTESPTEMIAANGRIYWTSDGGSGARVWASDGVVAPVNLFSGGFSSPPSSLYDANGTVYLSIGGAGGTVKKVVGTTVTDITGEPLSPSGFIHTSSHVYLVYANQLWVTTTASTAATQITGTFDFQFSGAGFHTPGFAALGNKLIFSNNRTTSGGVGPNTGSEIWISDGTTAGTTILKDIVTGSGSSNPHNFITAGGSVFFQATNGNGSVELWKTDGTAAGTVLVETLFAGGLSSGTGQVISSLNLDNMNVVDGILYFSFDDQAHGNELWRTDGTAAGTLMVKELNSQSFETGYSIPFANAGASLGGIGVFVGWTQSTGYELFTTAAGTGLLKDIDLGGGNSLPSQFALAGTKAYFSAFSAGTGTELWVTDGSAAGTYMVKDLNPGAGSGSPSGMVAIGNTVYFSADNGVNGHELWVSDGTAAGTVLLKDIDATFVSGFPRSSGPGGFVAAGSKVFFTASTNASGRELWATDGTAAGTILTKEIGTGAADANISSNILAYNNKVYFSAGTSGGTSAGIELWVSDGTNAGTVQLKDLNVTANGTGGTEGSNPNDFVLANNLVFFRANGANPFAGAEIYSSDGTAVGTSAITATLTSFSNLVVADNRIYFTAQGTSGQELYFSFGNTATLIDIVPGASGSNANNPVTFGTRVLFTAAGTTADSTELWISDSTPGGTFMVKNINPNLNAPSNPQYITVVGNKAYFVADNGTHGQELWVTDGTGPGTMLVKDINTTSNGSGGTLGASVAPLRAVDNGHLLFLANDGVSGGQELWITDGTTAGTFKVSNVVQPSGGFYSSSGSSINGGGSPSGTFTSVPYTLPAGGGDETFNGTPNPDLFDGLGGNDALHGYEADDTLIGGGGNDTHDGGVGADYMNGGSGNDTYIIDNVGDIVIETSGEGNDTAYTTVSYTLAAGIELEILSALNGPVVNLFGNERANTLVGNDQANTLNGQSGDDTLIGNGGADVFLPDTGDDTMIGGDGFDVASFGGFFRSFVQGRVANSVTISIGFDTDTMSQVEFAFFRDGALVMDNDAAPAQVFRLFNLALGSGPDLQGWDFFVDRIEDYGDTVTEVAQFIVSSAAFQAISAGFSNQQFVEYLYAGLGGPPDPGGTAFWTNRLNTGTSRAEVLVSFSESAEYRADTITDFTATGFFNTDDDYQATVLLYDAAFDRLADSPDLIFWAELLQSGSATLPGVANAFVATSEFQTATAGFSNAQLVDYFYQTALDRTPDPGDRNYWTNLLDTGTPVGHVLLSFAMTGEHVSLLAPSIMGGVDFF